MILDEIVEDKKNGFPGTWHVFRKQKCVAWQRKQRRGRQTVL